MTLTESFNNWDEQAICMSLVRDGWELLADLLSGRYEFKFIVDKELKHEPANKETVHNEHGTLNSVLWVTVPVEFILEGYENAQNLILAGSFNEWNERKQRMMYISTERVHGIRLAVIFYLPIRLTTSAGYHSPIVSPKMLTPNASYETD